MEANFRFGLHRAVPWRVVAYADLPPSSTQTHLFAEIQQLAHSFAAPRWCRGRSTARHGGLPFFPTHCAAEIKKLMQSLLILHFPVNRLHTRVLAYGQREEMEDGDAIPFPPPNQLKKLAPLEKKKTCGNTNGAATFSEVSKGRKVAAEASIT
ncbi:hypothetical protein C8J57DRAFT_1244613 [Mycena rebaudengoi]|nr:hypothetical protein C8J57DRAFT_1244613 [Mycena rebaudengoi]